MKLTFCGLPKNSGFVIARLDRAIQRKGMDYPVKPDNDNFRTEFAMN